MRAKIQDRVAYILNACRGRCVLHLGCADAPYTEQKLSDGTLLHRRLQAVSSDLYGVDIARESVEVLRRHDYKNVAVADAAEIVSLGLFGEIDFDVLVAGEIIEHLSNPGLFLDTLRPLLRKPSARLLVTTVNSLCAYRFVYSLLTGREAVHDDHVGYYSQRTLTRLLTRHGYEVEDFAFYPANESSPNLTRGRFWILWLVDRVAYRLHPTLGDGVMAICKAGK